VAAAIAAGGGVSSFNGRAGVVTLTSADIKGAGGILTLPKMLAGLILSNDATSPNTVIDIDVGSACSDDGTTMMVLGAAWTKTLAGPWTAGSGNAGLDTGTVAVATWYHVFLIERTDTSVVDVLFSTSPTAPMMPANYIKKRRIGSVATAAAPSTIQQFLQTGDFFLWKNPLPVLSNANFGVGMTNLTVAAPPGVRTIALITVYLASPSAGVNTMIYATESNGQANNSINLFQGAGLGAGSDFQILTNTASNVAFYSGIGGASGLWVTIKGYTDFRGK
jgi:hypothetical protein